MQTELIPVIHMINESQVFQNIETCLLNDIKKVFLINHQVSSLDLLSCAERAKKHYPLLWLGANLLGVNIRSVVDLDIYYLDALWSDYTLTEEVAKKRNFEGLLFTGLAFKYQPQPSDLKVACEEAVKVTDVITTSGAGTGKETPLEKVVKIRENIGDHPLAIASGVSIDNIVDYKIIVDYLLVASSITDESELIDATKLKELKAKLDFEVTL